MTQPTYPGSYLAHDPAWQREAERLKLIAAQHDPGTIRNLEALGVGPGWHCLDVGAGGGSLTAWLCERVGPTGHVLAVDLETRYVAALQYPNLEVRTLDILRDELPAAAFDLVLARFVLEHLTERERALARIVTALRPGGWLLVEDQDADAAVADPAVGEVAAALFHTIMTALIQDSAVRGADVIFGRRLYGLLGGQGLVNVGAEGRVSMLRGGSPGGQRMGLNAELFRPRAVATGLCTDAEVDAFIAFVNDPAMVWMGQITMAAWGQRPPTGAAER